MTQYGESSTRRGRILRQTVTQDTPRGATEQEQVDDDQGGIDEQLEDQIEAENVGSDETTVENRPRAQSQENNVRQGQTDPVLDDLDRELAAEQRWLDQARKRSELARIRALRARYEAGDLTAIMEDPSNPKQPPTIPTVSSHGLPRPKAPETYTKRNRAEYNRWERDCEGFFTRSPANFVLEQQKVDFGLMYASETMKTLWESHTFTKASVVPEWLPTWTALKEVMVNALGTPAERRQNAYEALRNANQRPNQSPTDLLDYMRPFWEELGNLAPPDIRVVQYIAALREDVQKELYLMEVDRRDTISKIEEHANVIFRRRPLSKNSRDVSPKKSAGRSRRTSPEAEGSRKTPKNAKKSRPRYSGPFRPKVSSGDIDHSEPKCFKCGVVGHIVPNCPQNTEGGSSSANQPAGKAKGRKK
jgi:hypothetical protein